MSQLTMCGCFAKNQLLLVIVAALVFVYSASGDKVQYVTPSQSVQSQNSESTTLLTLSMLAASTSDLLDTNTTLIFLEGNHTLETDLVLTNLDKLVIQTTNASVTASVTCSSGVNLKFINITQLKIGGLKFMSCSSMVELVDQLTLTDSTFYSSGSNSSALQLIQTNTNIVRSCFTSSTVGSLSNLSLPVYNTFQNNFLGITHLSYHSYTARVGGALEITSSNVEISSSHFDSNEAEVGGAIYSQSGSNIVINNSTFVNNKASCSDKVCSGGALFIGIGCTARASNSTFLNSTSEYSGGAIALLHGNFFGCQIIFGGNRVRYFGGGIAAANSSTIELVESNFSSNNAGMNGGAIFVNSVEVTINSSSFDRNSAIIQNGGVVYASHQSRITVHNSSFNSNEASYGGVVYTSSSSSITVYNTSFNDNEASYGGVMRASSSTITVHNSSFNSNEASYGGVVRALDSNIIVYDSSFKNNEASQWGGVVRALDSSITVHNSFFDNNEASVQGGVVSIFICTILVNNSFFNNNKAGDGGVVEASCNSSTTVYNSSFNNNKASLQGGVVYTTSESISVYDSSFNNNEASFGGVVYIAVSSITVQNSSYSHFTVYNSSFKNNIASSNGGAIYAFLSSVHLHTRNYSSNVQIANNTAKENGGAIYLSRTTLYISSDSSTIFGNLANNGGAIYANESILVLEACSETTIAGNTANNNGGGLYLTMSELTVKGSSTIRITSNRAHRTGGGLHADNSSIILEETVYFINNTAKNGAGIGLEKNAILRGKSAENTSTIDLTSNRAGSHGGALYVDDETIPDTCAAVNAQKVTSKNQCFSNYVFFNFFENSAGGSGSNLFGGLLDRCKVIELSRGENASVFPGLVHFQKASNISDSQLDTISSYPVRLCFCREGHPDCNYQPDTIEVNHGDTFSLQIITYDQVHTPVKSKIHSSLDSSARGITVSQDPQEINERCTKVNFILSSFSLISSVELTLSVEGPCNVSGNFECKVIIETACKCPIGFQKSIDNPRSCNCLCASVLQSYVRTQCNFSTKTIIRKDSFWITYTNYTNSSGYVIHPYCPYDYCHPPDENVYINLNIHNGEDTQCVSNRSGTLCGSCQPGFSVSLGSSACLHCPPYWPGLLVTIIIIFILSGIGLVALTMVLNLTVAIGTLNAIIFYANMMAANKSALFTTYKVSFASVFISWLNFDLGFDICFFKGMDTYAKTWLQLLFPCYIFLLVGVIIRLSYHFKFFGNLIGKKDPVATLATLILLSYAKLLQTSLTAFSSVTLVYPDDSKVSVWLPDATVGYLSLKHAVLFTVAILILLAGLIYTFLLFTWQWFLCCPRKRVKWITNQKFSSFFEKYHIPYTSKHRYWTGLLLLVRLIVYLGSAFNQSGDPRSTLLSTALIMTCLFLYIAIFGVRVYKTMLTNTSETIAYFNITALSITTLYVFDSEKKNQIIITNISVAIAFIQLLILVCCHTFRYANFKLYTKISNVPFFGKTIKRLTLLKKSEVHSEGVPLPADKDVHQFHELLDIIDRPLNTNDYKTPQICYEDKPAEPTKSVVEAPKPLLEQPPPRLEEVKEEEKQRQQLSRNDCKNVGDHCTTASVKVQSNKDHVSRLDVPECNGCLSKSIIEPPKPYLDPTTPLETDEKIKHEQTSREKVGIMKVEESHTISIDESKQHINNYSVINMSLSYDVPCPSTEIECIKSNITPTPCGSDKIKVIVDVHVDSQTVEGNYNDGPDQSQKLSDQP